MKILSLLFLAFGAVALCLGVYMLVDRQGLLVELDPTMRTVLAILLTLYGIFRLSTSIGGLRKKAEASK